MNIIDWVVMFSTLTAVISYGWWRGRRNRTTDEYLLAGRSMPWYAMALSIMATQASAVTFISTTGQAYVDGMRFVQFYFGLPLAMVILSFTAVPVFHRANVFTAYEYLEQRFDSKTRSLVSAIFLMQRGLAVGIALYAPAVVLSVLLNWSDQWTTVLMGFVVITYTVAGGIQAITWADFQQMIIMMCGLLLSFFMAIHLMPAHVGFSEALEIAGAAGKLNPVTFNFSWSDRYNIFSGLLGGMFLALAYFGCDQSQVQRYLTGKSIGQSRLSLLFNAVAKIPMQFFILLTGAMVFVFFTFVQPPMLFHPANLKKIESTAEYAGLAKQYDAAFLERKQAADALLRDHTSASKERYRQAQASMEATRKDAAKLVDKTTGEKGFNDTNYIFLTFVTKYLPVGIVGIVLAVILGAAMSTISAEINSLATVSVIDVYKRHVRQNANDKHYLLVSRVATAFWGLWAMVTAQQAKNMGSLVEAVNMIGSLFYGGLLGVFVLAIFFKRVGGTAAFIGVLVGEAAIFTANYLKLTSFLWFNVIGCVVVILTALLITAVMGERRLVK